MYVIEPNSFSNFELSNVKEFVECWSRYYKYAVKIPDTDTLINYFEEINPCEELTEENVIRLLRWKDPKYLTKTIKSGSNKDSKNDRVVRVLKKLATLNSFRNGAIDEEEFKETSSTFFPNGVIWEIFIFHICKPFEYPIADQHVFRAFDYHKECNLKISWKKYEGYKSYFGELLSKLHNNSKPKNIDLNKYKELDNALMVYGQFLKKYQSES